MEKGRFIVFMMKEKVYPNRSAEITESISKQYKRICYVCLSSTYDDVISWMTSAKIDSKKFYFVDTLSSYYGQRPNQENCFFASSPSDLGEIKQAISSAIKEKGCKIVIFDSISSLLEYKDLFSILKFTHVLMTEKGYSDAKKLFLVVSEEMPEEENKRLVTDLKMFADSVVSV